MKRFHFFLGFMTSVLLLSVCQASQGNVVGDSSTPPQTFCEGRMAWSAEITTHDVVDYTTFWVAFDAATLQDNFQHIHVDVTLDGKSAFEEMKYTLAPESVSVTCTDSGLKFEATRVEYTLILPPLPSGEHSISWKYTITSDLEDGVFDYPRGRTAEYKIKWNIKR